MSQQPCMWLMVVHEADAFTVSFFVGVALGFLDNMSSRAVFHIIPPPPLTMEVSICAAYNLISASVMHPGSFNSFIILKCRIRRPCDIS